MFKHKSHFTLSVHIRAIIAGLILFFASAFIVGGSFKAVTLLCALAALIVIAIKFKIFTARMSITLSLLILITVMGGLSALWAISGKFALEEFCKLFFALSAAVLILYVSSENGKVSTVSYTTVLSFCAAVLSFLSIDALSTRIFTTVLRIVPGGYFDNLIGVESGIRMVSILRFPNVYAGCAGIGVLLGLNNVQRTASNKLRIFQLCCLFVNAVGFLLAFSMGASAAIAVAFVVYIILEYKEKRAGLVALMLITLFFCAVNMAVISAFSFDKWDGIDFIPIASLAVCCASYCTAEKFVRPYIERIISGRAFAAVVISLLILAAAYIVAAFNITGPATIEAGATLSRAAYPDGGEHTLIAECEGDALVKIKSQNRVETMMHTYSVIYEGDLRNASFTVPEDSLVVYFEITAEKTFTLESLEYSGNSSGKVPLEYKLLPDFIANRLQGLRANQNAIQRTVFFEDGMKLFSQSPVIGLGLGAFGSAVKGVQSFYYETNYVHNHYIQSLLETGIIGLILFAGLIIVSFVLVIKSRRKNVKSVPALGALIVFMAVHASTEVVFSSAMYLVLAFGVFTVCGHECALQEMVMPRKVNCAVAALCAIFTLTFAVLLGMNMSAESLARNNPTFASMDKAVKRDVFEWEDYALSYVMASINTDADLTAAQKADEYANKLSAVRSNTIHLNLTAYYLTVGQIEKAMESARTHMAYCASSSDDWNEMFRLLMSAQGTYGIYTDFSNGVSELVSMMKTWDDENIGSIELEEDVLLFAERYE